MKRNFKKIMAGILFLVLFANITALANEAFSILEIEENDGSAFLKIEADKAYISCMMRAKDIEVNADKTEIRFRNAYEEDKSIYVINKETVFGRYEREIDKESLDIQAFVAGEMPGIDFFIPVSKYYKYSKKENVSIPVVAVRLFFLNAVGVGENTPDPIEEEFKMLRSFEIMQGDERGKLNLETPVTRAEMAQILINMLQLKGVAPIISETERFTDVAKTHWAYNAIHLAMQAHHIRGYGDGTFGPEDKVTNEQAIKLLVSALGYAPMAEEAGGYPDGYLKVAGEIGLTQAVSFVSTDHAKRCDIARLIMNAVYLPVMEQTVFEKDNPQYTRMDGTNGMPYLTFYDKYLAR